MERNNRDEDIMMRGTKQEMPGFRFRLLRPEKKRELWNPDFELLFLLRWSGRVSYEDLLCRSAFQRRRLIHFTLSC